MTTERMTISRVYSKLCAHLEYHKNKIDSKMHNHHIILFGEKGDEGLVADMRDIKKGYATMKTIGVAILITLLGNMAMIWVVWLR
jgi:hypothetical protein